MIECSREFLKANVDHVLIKNLVIALVSEISKYIWRAVHDGYSDLIYDISSPSDRSTRSYSLLNILKRTKKDEETTELTWSFISNMTIRELEKEFIDSNISYENKKTVDIYDKETIHRVIVVDWTL